MKEFSELNFNETNLYVYFSQQKLRVMNSFFKLNDM